jgi:hypothetical protein
VALASPDAKITGLFGSSRFAEGDKPTTMGDLFSRLVGRIGLPIVAEPGAIRP